MKRKWARIIAFVMILAGWVIWSNTALEVNEYEINSDRIPESFVGFRIVQVSDLHNAEFGEGNCELMDLLSQTDPDIIVITGDLIDSRHTDMNIALDFCRFAIQIAPVYYITGNHEARISEYADFKMDLAKLALLCLIIKKLKLPERENLLP